jgi:CHAT domain-containing protein
MTNQFSVLSTVAALLFVGQLPALAAEPQKSSAQQAKLDEATALNSKVLGLLRQGKAAEAEPSARQALSIRENILGPNHLLVAQSLTHLSLVCSQQGKFAEAEPLARQAITSGEIASGPENPELAFFLNNLAELYREEAKFAAAEPLYERAIAITTKAYGPNAKDLVTWLNNLALLNGVQGKYDKSISLYLRALKINETTSDTDRQRRKAAILNNVAGMYQDQRNYAEAEPFYHQALKIVEDEFGPNHPHALTIHDSLAELYRKQGKYSQAEPLYKHVIEISEQTLGADHPDVARSNNNLALLYARQGKYTQAEPLYRRAVKIWENSFGPDHPLVLRGLENLSLAQASGGQWSSAATTADRVRRGVRRYVDRELPFLSAKDQLGFLFIANQAGFHSSLSLGLERRSDSAMAELSAGWLANGKAVAQEALTKNVMLAADESNLAAQANVKQLLDVRRQLTSLVIAGAQGAAENRRKEQVDRLQQQEEQLSRGIARSTGRPTLAQHWIEPGALRKAIPAEAVLVDIARFDDYDFQSTGEENTWKPSRYAAWIIPPAGKGEISIVDLGEAERMDAAVNSLQKSMRVAMGSSNSTGAIATNGEVDAEKQILEPFTNVARLALRPLLEAIPADTKQILLSPDGQLWLVPWAALPMADGKYAIEQYQIRYLTSSRDLVASETAGSAPDTGTAPAGTEGGAYDQPKLNRPVVFADPDYDLAPGQVETATRNVLRGSGTVNATLRSVSGGRTLSALPKVGRLKGTAAEAAAIKPTLASFAHAEPITYLDQFATEGVFKALLRPQVLVLSTHGFFLDDQQEQRDERDGSVASPAQRSAPALTIDGKPVENPLLRCGLLLTGCNSSIGVKVSQTTQANQPTDDGILTGMEIVGTDLRGTELVVLSACETGLGDVHNGEGVAGLRQAFQLAGAKSVVATLWQIPDQDSAQIVSRFFANLAEGQSKADALRNAQLAQIELHRNRFGAAHPFFWAAFTITGE